MWFETLRQELAHGIVMIPPLLTGVTADDARAKPDPQTWSMLEVVCHLYDEEREDFRQRLDIILHRPEAPWPPIDPQGWVSARKYNERDLTVTLDGFVMERHRSLEWLDGLSAPDWEVTYKTPFGVMKAGDMLASWVAHDGLHLRQLVELRRSRVMAIIQPYDVRYAGDW